MSVESTREAVTRYVNSNHSDLSMMARPGVFRSAGVSEAGRPDVGSAELKTEHGRTPDRG